MGRKGEAYSTSTLLEFTSSLKPAQKDRLVSQGEILSSLVFENQCYQQHIKAHACTPTETGIITDDNYGQAQVLQMNTMWILPYLKESNVVIVPGFNGLSMSGRITTLGRGGSNKTAVLLATALEVEHVEIFTDVDGIYDQDPKFNEKSQKYQTLSHDQCLDLIHAGSYVMMEESVELAKKAELILQLPPFFREFWYKSD